MALVKPRLVSDMGDFTLVFPLLVKEQRHASPFSLLNMRLERTAGKQQDEVKQDNLKETGDDLKLIKLILKIEELSSRFSGLWLKSEDF